jgi:hypothetical protein
VPQVLGPSLFLYYINYIPTGLRLFADDIIANLVIKSNNDALILQRSLDKLKWEQIWKMPLDGFPPI